jgi:RNA polymerase sigma factor for flagellar operon FliA
VTEALGSGVFITNPGALLSLLGDDSRQASAEAPASVTSDEADVRRAEDAEEFSAADAHEEPDEDSPERDLLPPAAIDALLREHWAWPEEVLAELERRLPFRVPLDVLLAAARRGMWAAARRFDPARGVPFRGFAKQRVAGAVVDELRAERFVVRRHRADVESGHLRAALSGCSYDARFEDLTGEEAAWLAAWRAVAGVRALPVREEIRLAGAFDEDVALADVELDRRRMLHDLENAIAGLDPAQRRLVERVAFEGSTIEEASQPLSKSWGSRLYSTAIATLKRAMVRAGYGELFAPGALTTRSTFRGVVDAQPDA